MNYTRRIACVGEAMAELMLGENADHALSLGFAGNTLNTAVNLTRLLTDRADVAFVSVLGLDPLSARMLAFMESEAISTVPIRHSPDRLSGLYANEQAVVTRLKSYGINQGATKRGALGPRSLGEQCADNATRFDVKSGKDLTIVDTTAVGDSFNAGYLAATMNGACGDDAMSAGHHCALQIIAHAGAIIPKESW